MFQELLSILLSLVKTAWPLPDPDDKAAIISWLHGNEEGLAALVAFIAAQIHSGSTMSESETLEQAASAMRSNAEETSPDGVVSAINWGRLIELAKAIIAIIAALK